MCILLDIKDIYDGININKNLEKFDIEDFNNLINFIKINVKLGFNSKRVN